MRLAAADVFFCQNDRADHRHEEDQGRHLEGKQIGGVQDIADRFGDIVAANAPATALVAALREGALPALAGRMARVATDGLPHSEKVEVPGTNGGQALEVSLIPHGHAPDDVSVLLLARDITADTFDRLHRARGTLASRRAPRTSP